MTNFDYLIKLNLYAARSFNDPSVYPLFPWIIKNYSSKLRFTGEDFRDLSRPVGALNEGRLRDVKMRSREMEEVGEPSYLYTSYSMCPLSLFLYLIRLEPFTQQHIDIQGGRFDVGGRLFYNIAETFALTNTFSNDYRELIPEFFVTPEFLVNSNEFDLGRVCGEQIEDVELPEWAESALHFVYTNRKALESDIVSSKLNNWIDLVFGKQQRGPNAVSASNTFTPLLYDDVWVNKSQMTEERVNEIDTMLIHIGQVPPQMFVESHPVRVPLHPTPTQGLSVISLSKEVSAAHLCERKSGRVRVTVAITSEEIAVYEVNLRKSSELERVERVGVVEAVRKVVSAKEIVFGTATGVFEGKRRVSDRLSISAAEAPPSRGRLLGRLLRLRI
jgi:hypothetical protein